MISIHIRTAIISDAAAISRIHYEAQDRYNAFYEAVWTSHPRDFLLPLTTLAMEYSKSVFLVATCDTSSKVLGFIRYNIIDPSAAVAEPEIKSERQLSLEGHRPKTKPHLIELWKKFEDPREEEKDACYAKIHQGRRHTFVNLLMIDPKAQRRGIGKLLLEAVSRLSDREQIPTVLCSSREARRLYSQVGFKTVQTWTIDNEYWAREIERLEPELSDDGQPWAATFEGCSEEEIFMVRGLPGN